MGNHKNPFHKRLSKDNGFESQSKTIFLYLQQHIATASMVADATGITQKNITRYKRNLEKTNNNQKFRCVLSVNDCNDTTGSVNLYVNENASIKDRYDNSLISIYPNPTSDDLYIKISPKLIGSSYTLIDIHGTLIMSGILMDNTTKISLSEINQGVYFLCTNELSKVIKVVR